MIPFSQKHVLVHVCTCMQVWVCINGCTTASVSARLPAQQALGATPRAIPSDGISVLSLSSSQLFRRWNSVIVSV